MTFTMLDPPTGDNHLIANSPLASLSGNAPEAAQGVLHVSAALKTALLYVIKRRRGVVRGKTNVSANCGEVTAPAP